MGMTFKQFCAYRAAACEVDRVSERPEGVPRFVHLQVLVSRARENRQVTRGSGEPWHVPPGAIFALARFLVRRASFSRAMVRDALRRPEFGSEGEDIPHVD